MARGLNKVMVIGNIGRDPEMRFTPNGKSVANFTIASNRSWKSTDGNQHRSIEIVAQNLLLLSDTHPESETNDSEDTEEYSP